MWRQTIRALPSAHVATALIGIVLMTACDSAGTSGGDATEISPSASASTGAASTQPSASAAAILEGKFDVGGYELYLRCVGSGAPTVVYLHGYIHNSSGGGSGNAGDIPGLLQDRYRVCVYDRANVGLSDAVPGPLTGEDSVADLRALLAAADVPPPYVLLGASFGGLIADMYAAMHPDEVIGMVLLDASLPDEVSLIDERFVPPDEQIQPDDWKSATEQLDQLTTYSQAEALEGREPKIPLTYIGTQEIELPPHFPVEEMTAAIRQEQETFVARFAPGELILLDVPHFMEPVIPERIAQEVEEVIQAAQG